MTSHRTQSCHPGNWCCYQTPAQSTSQPIRMLRSSLLLAGMVECGVYRHCILIGVIHLFQACMTVVYIDIVYWLVSSIYFRHVWPWCIYSLVTVSHQSLSCSVLQTYSYLHQYMQQLSTLSSVPNGNIKCDHTRYLSFDWSYNLPYREIIIPGLLTMHHIKI